ncbi:MAG: EthD domain-containing protein [Actinomycetota bacterium]
MIKLICFVKRNPALDVEEFHRHWRERHAPIIVETPDLAGRIVRYEQNHRLLDDYGQPNRSDFDGVAIQWFESMDDFVGMVSSYGYRDRLAPDEAFMLDGDGLVWILTEPEETMIPGPEAPSPGCKVHTMLRRKPGMEVEEFHRYWREVHGPLFRDTPAMARHVLRYEQNRRTADDYQRPGAAKYDGVAIQWFNSPDDFWAMAADPAYPDTIGVDNGRFLDMDGLRWVFTDNEEVVIG